MRTGECQSGSSVKWNKPLGAMQGLHSIPDELRLPQRFFGLGDELTGKVRQVCTQDCVSFLPRKQ